MISFRVTKNGSTLDFDKLPDADKKALEDAMKDFTGEMTPAQREALAHAIEEAARDMPEANRDAARMAAQMCRDGPVMHLSAKAGPGGKKVFTSTETVLLPLTSGHGGLEKSSEIASALGEVAWSLPPEARKNLESLIGAHHWEGSHLTTWGAIALLFGGHRHAHQPLATDEGREAAVREVAAQVAAKPPDERKRLEDSLKELEGLLHGAAAEAVGAILKVESAEAGGAPIHFAKAVDDGSGTPPPPAP